MFKKLLSLLIILTFYLSGSSQNDTPTAIRENVIKKPASAGIIYPVKKAAKRSVQNIFSGEICDNGIDDDGDNLVDLNDTADCKCLGLPGHHNSGIDMIPNPSFDTMVCCPSTYSQVNCSKGWIQATSTTSDYMNTCGFVFGAATNAGLVPFPSGNGIMGCIFAPTWQEYIGTCLTSPMLAGHKYSVQMSIASTPIDGIGNTCNGGVINYSPIDITVFGAQNCSDLPSVNVNGGCPGSPWKVLGSTNYSPTASWGTITISFIPDSNINTIIIGSPCVLPSDYTYGPCYPYFYFDNLLVNTSISIDKTGSICQNDVILAAQTDTIGGAWQWYKNGLAMIGQTNDTLNVSGNSLAPGRFTAVYTIGSNCEEISDSVGVCNTTDVDHMGKNGELFTIYPNPTTGKFVIETITSSKKTSIIYDVSGKIVLTQSFNNTTSIDATNLDEGVYSVKISTEDKTITKKLVIVR